MRPYLTHSAALLKAATISSIDAIGGVTKASALLGMGTSALTKYASTAEEWQNNFIRVDLAVSLDRATGHPFITTAMNQLVSDTVPHAPGAISAGAILKLNGVLDDVVRELALAMEDDHMDAAEKQAVRSKIAAAQRSLSRLDVFVAGIHT